MAGLKLNRKSLSGYSWASNPPAFIFCPVLESVFKGVLKFLVPFSIKKIMGITEEIIATITAPPYLTTVKIEIIETV